MARRIYYESVKRWARDRPEQPVFLFAAPIVLIFAFIFNQGLWDLDGYSYTERCTATEWGQDNLCYLYLNGSPTEDIFIYPIGYDPWGRETPFDFQPGVKDWKLERSWGNGWREYPLDKTCTGTWCGGKIDGAAYSVALREGRDYELRISAIKWSPYDTINWSFNPSGTWEGEQKAPQKNYSRFVKPDSVYEKKQCQVEYYDVSVYKKVNITHYYNYTHCTNSSGSNTDCSIRTVETDYAIEEDIAKVTVERNLSCQTVGVQAGDRELSCPTGVRCDVVGDMLCLMDEHDGDPNLAFESGKGWKGDCVEI